MKKTIHLFSDKYFLIEAGSCAPVLTVTPAIGVFTMKPITVFCIWLCFFIHFGITNEEECGNDS
jgi:hypothetical protein